MSNIEFSEREKEIVAKAWQCFDEEPKASTTIDHDSRAAADGDIDSILQIGSDVWLHQRP